MIIPAQNTRTFYHARFSKSLGQTAFSIHRLVFTFLYIHIFSTPVPFHSNKPIPLQSLQNILTNKFTPLLMLNTFLLSLLILPIIYTPNIPLKLFASPLFSTFFFPRSHQQLPYTEVRTNISFGNLADSKLKPCMFTIALFTSYSTFLPCITISTPSIPLPFTTHSRYVNDLHLFKKEIINIMLMLSSNITIICKSLFLILMLISL